MSIATNIRSKGEALQDEANDRMSGAMRTGESMVARAENKAGEMKDAALDEINALVSTLNEKLRAAGIETANLAEAAKDKAISLEKAVVREVNERPFRTLAMVALAGIALGAFSRK